jgi:hypothetical protein
MPIVMPTTLPGSITATLALSGVLLATIGLAPASSAVARLSSDPDPQVRVERSLTLQIPQSPPVPGSVEEPGWTGSVTASRIAVIDGPRRIWRSAPLELRLERTDCMPGGCLRTVLTTMGPPAHGNVSMPVRVAPGLTMASTPGRLVPTLLERYDGERLLNRRMVVTRIRTSAEATGAVTTRSDVEADQAVRRHTVLRAAPAQATLDVGIVDDAALEGGVAASWSIPVAEAVIAVRRTTITTTIEHRGVEHLGIEHRGIAEG